MYFAWPTKRRGSGSLVFYYTFAWDCWNLVHLQISASLPFVVRKNLKQQLNLPFFMKVIILMC